jgi:biopolymer transport protein ExbD
MAMALGAKRPVNDINVTPLIDVVLVLLIIFMVMTPLAEKQMLTRVPEYEEDVQPVAPDAVPPDQTVLTVKKDGRILLNKQEMTVEEALPRLHAVFNGRADKVMFFNAEDGAPYGLAVTVLDQARGAGVNTIGMMTDSPPTAAEAAPAEGAAPTEPAPE